MRSWVFEIKYFRRLKFNPMKERDLDFYVNTPDEYFNRNALRMYAYFTSYNKPVTKKPFVDFIDAIYEVYFFTINNPSKPIRCKEIIQEIATKKGFKNADLLLYEDLLSIIASNSPGIKLNEMNYPIYNVKLNLT
jgi:hypothetical protein